ncbi:MAG: hypothetical protein GX811_09875, partial [Lentisphaerae bacterium]|nr:hypothetical protein [Lentisphaerota bacterium]
MKFFKIASNALREIVREPAFLILTLSLIYLIGLTPFFACFAFGEHLRLIRDGAFAYHLMLGVVAGATAASVTVFREMRKGSAASILSKPIGRSLFFLSKFAGVVVALLLFSVIATLAVLM